MYREPSREDDERLLRAMALRRKGWPYSRILDAVGFFSSPMTLTNVMRAVETEYRLSVQGKIPTCKAPGCRQGLTATNKTSLCRAHAHTPGICKCSRCARNV